MLSQDYNMVLKTSKMLEDQVLQCIRKVVPTGDIVRKLYIIPGAAILDRYIEAVYVDGQEVLTLEISG